jgi:phosphohistidine phosphatase
VTQPSSHGRRLWILRHAKAANKTPSVRADHGRHLASRGRRDADALAERIWEDRLGLAPEDLPEVVLCSSAARTTETAERVLAHFAVPPTIEVTDALYHADPDDVIEQVRLVDDTVRSVMVVGHNPTFHELALIMPAAGDVPGRRAVQSRGFPTCAVAIFELEAGSWRETREGSGRLLGLFTPPFSVATS